MFKPYPIYDFKSGLRLDREPWLSPADAFSKLYDWYIYKGVLKKRQGYTPFARMVHLESKPYPYGTGIYGAGAYGIIYLNSYLEYPVMGIHNYYKNRIEQTLFANTRRFNKYNPNTGMSEDITTLQIPFKLGQKEILPNDIITGSVSGDTAYIKDIVWDGGSWSDGDAHGTIILSRGYEGSFESGEELTVKGVTVAFAKESATYDEFTGDDANFFWFENFRNIGYITNFKDKIHKYDGNYLTRFNIDLDFEGGPDNDVNTCLLIFHFKNRILLLKTIERGEACYQRVRWSQVVLRGQAVVFRDDDYSDADRDDEIIGAAFIGNELIVGFERGFQKISYTGDTDVPFRWDSIDSDEDEGLYATMSLIPFKKEVVGISNERFVACDAREVYGIDEKIPNMLLNFNLSALHYCYSKLIKELRMGLFSYPTENSEKPDELLVLNYKVNNFSIFRIPLHVIGYSILQSTISIDDMIGISLDDLDYSLDDLITRRAGYSVILMGDRNGQIFKMFDGDSDNGVSIGCLAEGAEWNPFSKEGRKAILGWLDFLVDKDENASFNVEFFINTENSSYQIKTVECTETGTSRDMVLKRLYCGAEGDFHRISLDNNATGNRPEIHAIIPYFEQGSPIG